jgi:hypothetical protein
MSSTRKTPHHRSSVKTSSPDAAEAAEAAEVAEAVEVVEGAEVAEVAEAAEAVARGGSAVAHARPAFDQALPWSTTFGLELRMAAELAVNLVDKRWRELGRRRRIPGLRLRALEWRSGRVATNEAARGRTS